eukprot:6472555-Amphidinium_carterae.2
MQKAPYPLRWHFSWAVSSLDGSEVAWLHIHLHLTQASAWQEQPPYPDFTKSEINSSELIEHAEKDCVNVDAKTHETGDNPRTQIVAKTPGFVVS